MIKAFFSVIVITIIGTGLGYLAELKSIGEATYEWFHNASIVIIVLAIIIKVSDMEGDFTEATAKIMSYAGFIGVCLFSAAFINILFQQHVEAFDFASTIIGYIVAAAMAVYYFKEAFLEESAE